MYVCTKTTTNPSTSMVVDNPSQFTRVIHWLIQPHRDAIKYQIRFLNTATIILQVGLVSAGKMT